MVRLLSGLTYFALLTNAINGASLPESNNALNILEEHAGIAPRSADIISPDHSLERRKGGGGRGGGSSGGGSSSGGSSGGGGGGGGRGTGGSSRSSTTSTTGGQTRYGSGPARSYGGGYYGGGAAVPYSAGGRSTKGLIAAPLLVGGAALVLMPGIWLYSVYPYHYNNPYRFYNRTANRTNSDNNNNNNNKARGLVDLVVRQTQMGANESLPVTCLCQEFSSCGCDENTDEKYLNDLVGNGSYAALNKTLVTVSDVNNTRTLIINGTLPNGTTAPGGQDDAGVALGVSKYAGYYAMGLVVLYGVML
jgi:hypothetical protein